MARGRAPENHHSARRGRRTEFRDKALGLDYPIHPAAFHEALEVGGGHVYQTDPRLCGSPRDVRGEVAVRASEQGAVSTHRLDGHDVSRISCEGAVLESCGNIILVYERTAGAVDKQCRFFEERQSISVYYFAGLVRERAVEGDDIRIPEAFFERHDPDGGSVAVDSGCTRVVVDGGTDVHAEASAYRRDSFADLAEADYVKVLAVQLYEGFFEETELFRPDPLTVVDRTAVHAYFVGKFEYVRDCHLGCRVSAVLRYVGYGDTMFFAALEVDDVVASCQNSDVLERRQLLNDFPVEYPLVCDRAVEACGPCRDVFLIRCVVHFDFTKRGQSIPRDVPGICS